MESFCQAAETGEKVSLTSLHPFVLFRGKKRSAGDGSGQAAKRFATSNDNQIDLDSFGPIDVKVKKLSRNAFDLDLLIQVGDFLILKTDNEPTKNGESQPPLWRVDGKTLIQKYECTDKVD